jgi:lipopolysaccharide export system protein LptA
MKQHVYILLLLILSVFTLSAQREKIELLGADELEGVIYKGEKANLLNGNVRIKHSGSIMGCNRAYLFVGQNNFDAFGNVSIKQSNGMTIYGDSLFYNGDTKIAKLRGNVRVIDKQMTLTTRMLDYNMETKSANYFNGGTIVDKGATLKSEKGFFDSKNEYYTFKGKVLVLKDNYRIVSDTLKYSSTSQKAFFYGPTHIYSNDQTMYTESGIFNTKDNKAWFNKNSWVQTPTYKLSGDSLYFDDNKGYGYAVNNVKIESFKEKATIYGDVAISDTKKSQKKVFGNALLIDYSEKDTTFIKADTLISVDDTIKKKRFVEAINNVEVVKGELSALSDYMLYNDADSNIIFKKDPILWSGLSQITGDSIKILLSNGAVDKMHVYRNSFIISQNEDDPSKFTQVKGNNMLIHFRDGELHQLDVDGNGESIYYAFNEDKEYIGVNSVVCGDMKMFLKDGNMDLVKFYNRPIASFTPPDLVDPSKTKLGGFTWNIDKKPVSNTIKAAMYNRGKSNISTSELNLEETVPTAPLSKKEQREKEKQERKDKKNKK